MTITSSVSGYSLLDDCSDYTTWNGESPATVTDFYITGTSCVGFTVRGDGANDIYVDTGTYDLSGSPCHVRFWMMTTALKELLSEASDGIQFYCTDGSNTAYWTIGGSDTYPGGWWNLVVDVSQSPTSGTKPTDMSVCTSFGIRFNHTGTAKNSQNTWIDHFFIGDGSLGFSNFSGLITVGNITDAGSQFALTGYYLLTLLDSCTAGLALVAGIGIFNEPAGGITLINRTLPGAVWEDASAVRPMHISLVETTTEIIAGAWIEEADTPATDIDSVTAKVHDLDGAEVIDLEAGSGGGAAELGVWKWTGDASLLEARTAYVLRVTATRGTDTWYRNKGFSKAG